MQKVRREQLLDYQSYDEVRGEERERILPIKKPRRIALGENLVFLFENAATIRYQIQEMMRAEQIVKEAAIREEMETYNSLLGDEGQLACALLITIDDPLERRQKLEQWLSLPGHIYLKLEDGSRVYADYDPSQVGEDRLSAVQYLKFDLKGRPPTAIGSDMDTLEVEAALSPEQRTALREDLKGR